MKTQAQRRELLLIILIGLFALISLASLVFGWFYLASISSSVAKLNMESEFLGQESQTISASMQKYNRVSEYVPVVIEVLPQTKEISSFLADVSKVAAADKIKIVQSTVGTDAKKGNDPSMSQTIAQGDYFELKIEYSVEGSYQNFQKMIADLGTLRRLNNVSQVMITKSRSALGADAVLVVFVDSIYIKK